MKDLGVTVLRRETFLASTDLACELLKGLGLPDYEADKTVALFRDFDRERLYRTYAHYNEEEKMRLLEMEAAKELEALFEEDARAARTAAE